MSPARARVLATLGAVAVAGAGAGCGVQEPVAEPAAGASGGPPTKVTARTPLQVANGPLEVTSATLPLAARLDRPDRLRVPFKRPPRSGLLLDLDTGEVL